MRLVVTYLIVNDWKFDEIVAAFRLDENELISLLLKLDELRIVDFQPPKRMRKLTARNFSWRKDGAVQEYFLRRVIPEFFNARFDSQGDEFRFVGGLLSSSSMLRLQASIRRFADEYEQLAHQDARLPLEERHGWSAILALRLWEYSEFSKLRRDKPAARKRREEIEARRLPRPTRLCGSRRVAGMRAVSRHDPTRISAKAPLHLSIV